MHQKLHLFNCLNPIYLSFLPTFLLSFNSFYFFQKFQVHTKLASSEAFPRAPTSTYTQPRPQSVSCTRVLHLFQSVNLRRHIIITRSPQFKELTLSGVLGFDKHRRSCIHHFSMVESPIHLSWPRSGLFLMRSFQAIPALSFSDFYYAPKSAPHCLALDFIPSYVIFRKYVSASSKYCSCHRKEGQKKKKSAL